MSLDRSLPRWYDRTMAPQEDPDLFRDMIAARDAVLADPHYGMPQPVPLHPLEAARFAYPAHVRRAYLAQHAGVVAPRPPSSRGWGPVGVVTSGPFAGSVAFQRWSEAQCAFWDENGAPDPTREADATFENEVRPR